MADAADGSRERPSPAAQAAWDADPFRRAVLASPPRLEDSTRPAVILTGMQFHDMIRDRYEAWQAGIAAANAAAIGARQAEPVNEEETTPLRRRRAPVSTPV